MKSTLNEIQERIDNDPKLKQAVNSLKPKKNIWGILGIIFFFFVPELLVYIWQEALVSWAHKHTLIEVLEIQRWMYGELEKMFSSGVSWLNILLGSLLLLWIVRSE